MDKSGDNVIPDPFPVIFFFFFASLELRRIFFFFFLLYLMFCNFTVMCLEVCYSHSPYLARGRWALPLWKSGSGEMLTVFDNFFPSFFLFSPWNFLGQDLLSSYIVLSVSCSLSSFLPLELEKKIISLSPLIFSYHSLEVSPSFLVVILKFVTYILIKSFMLIFNLPSCQAMEVSP